MTKLRFVLRLMALGALLATGACGKKCENPITQPFQSITGVQWRLITDTNPNIVPVPISVPSSYKTLDRFTFEIWQFNLDGSGTITQVEHNDQHNSEFLDFQFSLTTGDSKSGSINFKFTPPAPASSGSTSTTNTNDSTNSQSWQLSSTYQLGTQLQIMDSNGYTYTFVEFQGVVPPDSTCTF